MALTATTPLPANALTSTPRIRLRILVVFWCVALITVACMALAGPWSWDTDVYWKAAQTLKHGEDPYAIGIAAQQAFHDGAHGPNEHAPFTYVYSPMTLPILRLIGVFPGWLLGPVYGLAFFGGFLLQLWAGYQTATERERHWLIFLLPLIVFFPGLLADDVILSGNLVYILYGLVLAAACCGVKTGKWLWFYIAVLAASCFKAPLLTLLAFPILVAEYQWVPACLTGAAGLSLFGVQALIWPKLFQEYMLAVRLQFDWNHDFGFAPAGILAKVLWNLKKPFNPASTILYLVFACVLGIVLLLLSNKVKRGELSREQWLPLALVGTILLNPRIKEYDIAAITVPMVLIGWRFLRSAFTLFQSEKFLSLQNDYSANNRPNPAMAISATGWFVALNVIGGLLNWRQTELAILIGFLALGIWSLYRESRFRICAEQVENEELSFIHET